MVLDEGEATYIMSYSCWQALGSPMLAASKIVVKSFDRHLLIPRRTRGKTIMVEVEVVNVPLYYNLLLK